MINCAKLLCVVTGALVMCLVQGCGYADQRLAVAGSVTLDGKPIKSGALSLVGDDGEYASTDIRQGHFEFSTQTGLPPKIYLVQVYGFESTGRVVPDPDRPGEVVEDTRQVVPARYNDASKLRVEVTAENASEILLELTTD